MKKPDRERQRRERCAMNKANRVKNSAVEVLPAIPSTEIVCARPPEIVYEGYHNPFERIREIFECFFKGLS